MRELAKGRPPGEYRLNICQEQCRPEETSTRCTAELFRALQHEKGIPGDGPFATRAVPAGATLVYTHRNSREL